MAFDPRAFENAVIDQLRAGGRIVDGPFAGRRLLLLTTRGSQTGEPRLRPLVYTRDGASYVVVASKGGADTDPAWYRNLLADPHVTVEAEGETFAATATAHASGPERDRLYAAHAAENPTFLEYQQKTTRVIPVVVLERVE